MANIPISGLGIGRTVHFVTSEDVNVHRCAFVSEIYDDVTGSCLLHVLTHSGISIITAAYSATPAPCTWHYPEIVA